MTQIKVLIDKDQELNLSQLTKRVQQLDCPLVVPSNGVPNHKKTTVGESQPENWWIFIRKNHCNIFQVQAWSHPTRSEECHGFESQQLCEPGTFYQSSWFRSTIRKERCEFFGKKLRKFLPAKKHTFHLHLKFACFQHVLFMEKGKTPYLFFRFCFRTKASRFFCEAWRRNRSFSNTSLN